MCSSCDMGESSFDSGLCLVVPEYVPQTTKGYGDQQVVVRRRGGGNSWVGLQAWSWMHGSALKLVSPNGRGSETSQTLPGMVCLARDGDSAGGNGGSSTADAVNDLPGSAPGLCLGSGEYMPCPSAQFMPTSSPTFDKKTQDTFEHPAVSL